MSSSGGEDCAPTPTTKGLESPPTLRVQPQFGAIFQRPRRDLPIARAQVWLELRQQAIDRLTWSSVRLADASRICTASSDRSREGGIFEPIKGIWDSEPLMAGFTPNR